MSDAARASQKRFEALNLADCRMMGIQVRHEDSSGSDTIDLDLLLVAGEHAAQWRPARLRFLRSAAVEVHIDVWAKGACADTIDESSARHDAEAVRAALHEYNEVRERAQPLATLLLFTIELCSPSGRVQVVAQDFELDEQL